MRVASFEAEDDRAAAEFRKRSGPSISSVKIPSEGWDSHFQKESRSPAKVRKLVQTLHRARRYDDVIDLIQAALIHNQSQPWMYDILAIAMKQDGRPQADVERALLSRVDFTGADVQSMIFSAAYLTRFGATTEALRMYRQASTIAPHRPEPYILGLKLARRMRDADAVGWAAEGVLAHGWIADYQRVQRDARNAANDARRWLTDAQQHEAAGALAERVSEASRRDLHVRLEWNGPGDLDLSIQEPRGSTCSHRKPTTSGGGFLLHDGSGPDQARCYDEYVCPRARSGEYRLRIRHVRGDIVGKRARLVVTRYKGTPDENTKKLSVQLGVDDRIVRVPLRNGRRKQPAPISDAPLISLDQILRPKSAARSRDGEARVRRIRISPEQVRRAGAGVGIGFQPVVSLIPEGVGMTATAVVSADRRYVRISTSPFFNSIADVFTFSFLSLGGSPPGNQQPVGP